MQIINFSEANCRHCYKCVRSCKVKAIQITNDQAHIVEEKCIACGQCFTSCPQNARNIQSDLEFVLDALKSGKKITVSLAPSFKGFFKEAGKFITALKKIGFNRIEETAVGADIVSALYKKDILKNNRRNYITTCCPSAVFLIEKYYPSLIPELFPFVSPMIAHGQVLKKEYPNEVTVFIGPCISKKCEAMSKNHLGFIDAVLTFDEIITLFQLEQIDYLSLNESEVDKMGSEFGSKYPLIGGILDTISNEIESRGLNSIRIDGLDECKEIFQEMLDGNISNCCIEVSACKKSCIGGPAGSSVNESTFVRLQNIKELLKKSQFSHYSNEITENFHEEFHKPSISKFVTEISPPEDEIENILKSLGKNEEGALLNCGGCGYDTCNENAKSIFYGMSHLDMCIHYLRKKAERLSNEIFENSPNAILILNNKFEVLESNIAFSRYFGISPTELKTLPIKEFLDIYKLNLVLSTKKNILWEKIHFPAYSLHMGLSIIAMENQEALLVVLTDITQEIERKEKINSLRENTLKITQGVIEKQMRVAQEIASLLGETTAETKVALNKLKDVFKEEEGNL